MLFVCAYIFMWSIVGRGDGGDSDDTQAGVDSLNVSVTGGIIL